MNLKQKIISLLTHHYLMLLLRLFLGYYFLMSGWEKINHLDAFVEIVHAYEILPYWLAEIFGTALPFVEILVAVWFLFGIFLKFTSALTALMLLSFMIATLINLIRGHELESCGCTDLSEYEEGFGWHTFFRQVWFMFLISLVFFGRHTFLSVDALLKKRNLPHDSETEDEETPPPSLSENQST